MRAWPAIGVRQEPSSTARKARSAASAVAVSAIVDRGDQRARRGVVGARLDADGALADRRQKFVDVEHGGRRREEPEPLQPGDRKQRRVDFAASSLRSRVSTLPRNGTIARSGRNRLTMACRRSDAVPTTAPSGRSRKRLGLAADEGIARVLARQEAPTAPARPAAPSAYPSTNARRGRWRRPAAPPRSPW